MQVYGYDILTAGHNLACHLVAKAYDTLQYVLFFLNVFLCRQFKRLSQLVHAEGVVALLHYLLGYHARPEQQRADGPEELAHEQDAIDHPAAEVQGIDARIDLRHYLAKEQQEECEQHRGYEELQPVRAAEVCHLCYDIVQQHDDCHVDKVIGDKDCCQCALRIFPEHYNLSVLIATLVECGEVFRRETEECNLCAAGKA